MNDLNNGECDPIVKCECCGTECHVRGGQHRGATNWYEPVKPKPPFKDALRGFTHCPLCGKEAEPSMLTVEQMAVIINKYCPGCTGFPAAKAIHAAMVRKGEEG